MALRCAVKKAFVVSFIMEQSVALKAKLMSSWTAQQGGDTLNILSRVHDASKADVTPAIAAERHFPESAHT